MTKPDRVTQEGAKRAKRGGGPRALAATLAGVTAQALDKRGLGAGRLLTDWQAIVGDDLAERCLPQKIVFPRNQRNDGVLHLLADPAWAPEIQHLEPLIIERINSYFGYKAVTRLALRQGSLPRREKIRRRPPRALTAPEQAALGERIAPITDESLRMALEALGRTLLAPPDDDR